MVGRALKIQHPSTEGIGILVCLRNFAGLIGFWNLNGFLGFSNILYRPAEGFFKVWEHCQQRRKDSDA